MPEKIEEIINLSEVNNLLNIYSGFSGIEKQKLIEQYKGENFLILNLIYLILL